MDFTILTPSAPFVPNSAPGVSMPCHAGFGGLNAVERAVHAEILHRAYSIWEGKGQPNHSQLADWLEAEAEVRGEGKAGPGAACD